MFLSRVVSIKLQLDSMFKSKFWLRVGGNVTGGITDPVRRHIMFQVLFVSLLKNIIFTSTN